MTTKLLRYQDEPTVLKNIFDTTVDLSSGIYFVPPVMSYTMHERLEYKSVQICTLPSWAAVTSSSV